MQIDGHCDRYCSRVPSIHLRNLGPRRAADHKVAVLAPEERIRPCSPDHGPTIHGLGTANGSERVRSIGGTVTTRISRLAPGSAMRYSRPMARSRQTVDGSLSLSEFYGLTAGPCVK